MKLGVRTPSLKRRISARTSWKRAVRHRAGVKMPRGMGIVTNPKKAVYNKVYNKTTISADKLLKRTTKTSKKTPAESVTEDNWNTGNFKTREDLISKAKEKNINTSGKTECKRCGHDTWAIAYVKFLFVAGDAVFCQNCGKTGLNIKDFNELRGKNEIKINKKE